MATPPRYRAQPRLPSHLRATLRLTDWGKVDAFVGKNLSRGGIFLAMTEPAQMASRVVIDITTPDGSSLQLTGVVAHVLSHERAQVEGRSPGVGIKFDPLDQAAQAGLGSLMSELARTWRVAGEPDRAGLAQPVAEPLVSAFRAELGALREKDVFAILGIEPSSERIEVVRAYAEQLARWNPERFADCEAEVRAVVAEIVILLTHAHDTLMDDKHRLALEARLRPGAADDPVAVISDSGPPVLAMADELIAQGRLGEACSYLSQALEREPRNLYIRAAFHSVAGRVAMDAGDITRAAHSYGQAVRACPDNTDAIAGLRLANQLQRSARREPLATLIEVADFADEEQTSPASDR